MSFELSHEPLTESNRPSVDVSRENESASGAKPRPNQSQSTLDGATKERLDHVLQSDIGISTLLTRLKQSISSARDFGAFLKKRATLEEEHAQGLKKISKTTHDLLHRQDARQASFAESYGELLRVNERMADHGLNFATELQVMAQELHQMTDNAERERKQQKQNGLAAEKRVQDSEAQLEKARGKYESVAEQYERARTGDRQGGKFGIKKSAAQQEEDLLRKVQAADAEYAAKVQSAQAARQELITHQRPQAIRALHDVITECDSAVSLQMLKYASLTERLLLGSGLCVSPLKATAAGTGPGPKSLREVVRSIDNEKDLQDFILMHADQAGPRPPEIKYEKHPALASPKQAQPLQQQQQPFNAAAPQLGYPHQQQNAGLGIGYGQQQRPGPPGQQAGGLPYQYGDRGAYPGPGQPSQDMRPQSPMQQYPHQQYVPQQQQAPPPQQYPSRPVQQMPQMQPPNMGGAGALADRTQRADSLTGKQGDSYQGVQPAVQDNFGPRPGQRPYENYPAQGSNVAEASQFRGYPAKVNSAPTPGAFSQQLHQHYIPGPGSTANGTHTMDTRDQAQGQDPNYPRDQQSSTVHPTQVVQGAQSGQQAGLQGAPLNAHAGPTGGRPSDMAPRHADMLRSNLPALKPVFGVSLDELFQRDGTAVPTIVYQCVQAVDLFGLDVEGIYRTSGSAPVIMELKAMFDHDSSQVDFRNPAAFKGDINSVTTLLKRFLRDLPDPLLTAANYDSLIQAARIDDDVTRRDNLHAIINALPDPNYATLRVLTLHLNRVGEHSANNRMTPNNMAICLAPTLLGQRSPDGQRTDINEPALQTRVVETIILNTLQIFDDDD